jgi:AcrR family transcriptional regulator
MSRKYELKRRAEKQEETRRRIVESVVELHGTIGLAQTTISAIAEKAGVQRLTVYRHFPDERSLFRACVSHWMEENPLPDPALWLAISDPRDRLRCGLLELYAFYERAEPMLSNVARDASLVPAVEEAQQPFLEAYAQIHQVLGEGWVSGDGRQPMADAALAHAMAFGTWQSLVREQGLAAEQAVDLLVCLLECATERNAAS